MERCVTADASRVGIAQVSVSYILNAIKHLEETPSSAAASDPASETRSNVSNPAALALPFMLREESLAAGGIDVHSCLHFLIDLYSQWLQTSSSSSSSGPGSAGSFVETPPLVVLTEMVRSMLMLSDLFTEVK